MLHCFTSLAQIVLCSLVVYFALALYFTPPHPLPHSIKLDYWLGCIPATFIACSRLGGAITLPYLSLTTGWGMRLTRWLIRYLAGCRCHPYCITYIQGVLLPPSLHYSSLLGCVAATLLARTLRGVLPPPPILC